MAVTAYKTAGGIVSTGTWTDFTVVRLGTSDDSYATSADFSQTSTGEVDTFSFGLPNCTIDGIEAQAEFSANGALKDAWIKLSFWNDSSSSWSDTEEQSVSGSTDQTKTYGGATSLWGKTWVKSDFDNGTFIAKIEGRSDGLLGKVCQLDFFQVRVHYTEVTGFSGKYNGKSSPSKIFGQAVSKYCGK